jgi:hypothetical protein
MPCGHPLTVISRSLTGWALVAFSWSCSTAPSSAGWPDVVALRDSVAFADAKTAAAEWTIRGAGQAPLYHVACHAYGFEGDTAFDYSGDFECRLTSMYSEEEVSTLFTENWRQTRDWESRARFLAEELVGRCAAYPEHGLVRHFRLRGMLVTLSISRPLLDSMLIPEIPEMRLGLKSFHFSIAVAKDSTARTSIAEPVRYAAPTYGDRKRSSLTCDRVRVSSASGTEDATETRTATSRRERDGSP